MWVGTEKIGEAYLVLGLPGGGQMMQDLLIFSVLQSGFDTSHEGAGTDTGGVVPVIPNPPHSHPKSYVYNQLTSLQTFSFLLKSAS